MKMDLGLKYPRASQTYDGVAAGDARERASFGLPVPLSDPQNIDQMSHSTVAPLWARWFADLLPTLLIATLLFVLGSVGMLPTKYRMNVLKQLTWLAVWLLVLARIWQWNRRRVSRSFGHLPPAECIIRFRGAGFLWPYYIGAMEAIIPYLPRFTSDHLTPGASPTETVRFQGCSGGCFAALAAACGPAGQVGSLLYNMHHSRTAVEQAAATGDESAAAILRYLDYGIAAGENERASEHETARLDDVSAASVSGTKSESASQLSQSRQNRRRYSVANADFQHTFTEMTASSLTDKSSYHPPQVEQSEDSPSSTGRKRSVIRHGAEHRPHTLSVKVKTLFSEHGRQNWWEFAKHAKELRRMLPLSQFIISDVMKNTPLEKLQGRLCIIAWDLLSWQPVFRDTWSSRQQICDWAIASCRIPFVTGPPVFMEGMLLCDAIGADRAVPLPATKLGLRVSALAKSVAQADIHPRPQHKFTFLDAARHLSPWREVYVRERGRLDAAAYMYRRFGKASNSAPSFSKPAVGQLVSAQADAVSAEADQHSRIPNSGVGRFNLKRQGTISSLSHWVGQATDDAEVMARLEHHPDHDGHEMAVHTLPRMRTMPETEASAMKSPRIDAIW